MDRYMPVAKRTRRSEEIYFRELYEKLQEEKRRKNKAPESESSGCARPEKEKIVGSQKLAETESCSKDCESTASVGSQRPGEKAVVDVDSDSDSGSGSLAGKAGGEKFGVSQQTGSPLNVTGEKAMVEPGSVNHPVCIDGDEEEDDDASSSSSSEKSDCEDSNTEDYLESSTTDDDTSDDDYIVQKDRKRARVVETSGDKDSSDDGFVEEFEKTGNKSHKAHVETSDDDEDSSDDGFVDEFEKTGNKSHADNNHNVVGQNRKKARVDDAEHHESGKIDDNVATNHRAVPKCGLDNGEKKVVVLDSDDGGGDGHEDNDEQKVYKPRKRASVNVKKNSEMTRVLVNTILDRGKACLDDYVCSSKAPQQPSDDETILPLKFTFGSERQPSPDISESDQECEKLWTEFDFVLRSCEIGSHELQDEDDLLPPGSKVDRVTLCRQGKHQFIIDEEVGLKCLYCQFVKLEIKYCCAEFGKNSWGKSDARERDRNDNSRFFEFGKEFCCDSGSDHASCDQADGTVWDLIPGTRSSMFPHQREGFEFIWNKIAGSIKLETLKNTSSSDVGSGCIMSHAPGTGKTRLTIVFLQTYMRLYPKCRPIIIAPASMLLTWEEEFQKWNVDILIHNLSKIELSGKDKKAFSHLIKNKMRVNLERDLDANFIRWLKLFLWCSNGGILGISYPLFEQLAGKKNTPRGREQKYGLDENIRKQKAAYCEEFRRVLLDYPGLVILDEGHTPRNKDSLIWKAVSEIKTQKRIILSGTLFQNNYDELYNTLCLAKTNFDEEIEALCKEYSDREDTQKRKNRAKSLWSKLTNSIGKGHGTKMEAESLKAIKAIIYPWIHICPSGILQQRLPGKRDVLIKLKPTALQELLLDEVQRIKNYLKRQYKETLASIHPSLLLTKDVLSVSKDDLERDRMNPHAGVKTEFLMELILLSEALNEKVLVFSQFVDPLIFIKDLLRSHRNWHEGREVMYLDGTCDIKQRHASIKVFNDPCSEAKVLLASTKACGEGINLVGASRVVLLDVEWNPSVMHQAICRAFRVGQKKFVYTYHLITSGSNEEDKSRRQAEKDRQSQMIFSTSDRANHNLQKFQAAASEDKILDEMVRYEKFKSMSVELLEQDANLMGNVFVG